MNNQFSGLALKEAVIAICPEIHSRLLTRVLPSQSDLSLWRELSCCLLSSQVPYPIAVAAAEALENAGLFSELGVSSEDYRERAEAQLRAPLVVGQNTRRYRFPNARAKQFALSKTAVEQEFGSLKEATTCLSSVDLRNWLIRNAPGIGPKQASMFLRNIGHCYDFAIIDRHVLMYMGALGLREPSRVSSSTLGAYHETEARLKQHASELGYPVGLMDWAIWIVMRVATQRTATI